MHLHQDFSQYVQSTVDNGCLTVRLTGDIDHHTAMYLRPLVDDKIFEARPNLVRLELSGVAFMDSAGLGFILGRSRTAGEVGAKFCVSNPTEQIDRILKMAGTERLIHVARSAAGNHERKEAISIAKGGK